MRVVGLTVSTLAAPNIFSACFPQTKKTRPFSLVLSLARWEMMDCVNGTQPADECEAAWGQKAGEARTNVNPFFLEYERRGRPTVSCRTVRLVLSSKMPCSAQEDRSLRACTPLSQSHASKGTQPTNSPVCRHCEVGVLETELLVNVAKGRWGLDTAPNREGQTVRLTGCE